MILTGCGPSASNASAGSGTSSGGSATPEASGSAPASSTPYEPVVNPAEFGTVIDNPYFPLTPGTTVISAGTRDGLPMRHELITTSETKEILGVTCVVLRDTVTSNGALVEQTTDWYAQHSNGDVWYFGEATAEFQDGYVVDTHGSWEAGVDGAQPGIIMKADPQPGDVYHQEFRPGEAEDMGEVLRFDPTITIPAGTFENILVTEDTDPLNPDRIDEKYFAPGIGVVYSHRVRSGHEEETFWVETRPS